MAHGGRIAAAGQPLEQPLERSSAPKAEELFLSFWTRPGGLSRLGKAASERSEQRAACGGAAPTSESPEPPRSPRLPAHLRAPVGHRFYAHDVPACTPLKASQNAALSQRLQVRCTQALRDIDLSRTGDATAADSARHRVAGPAWLAPGSSRGQGKVAALTGFRGPLVPASEAPKAC